MVLRRTTQPLKEPFKNLYFSVWSLAHKRRFPMLASYSPPSVPLSEEAESPSTACRAAASSRSSGLFAVYLSSLLTGEPAGSSAASGGCPSVSTVWSPPLSQQNEGSMTVDLEASPPAAPEAFAIRCRDVCRSYGKAKVLSSLTLSVPQGHM